MSRLRTFFHRHKTFFLSIGFLVAFSITVSYATPPTSPYNPGDTLDPGCAPNTANCTVTVGGGGGSSQWDAVTGGINYAGGRVGIGTTTPTSTLDVSGEVKAVNLNITGTGVTVAAPANAQITVQYDPSAYNNSADGHDTNYRIYAYKTVGGGRVYSASYASLASPYTDDNSGNTYLISLSWNAAAGADGYRIINSDFGSYDEGYDTTATSLEDGDGSFSYSFSPNDLIVTPSTLYSNANTVNGSIAVGGAATFSNTVSINGLTALSDALLASGTFGGGTATPDLGAGTRMMWIPSVSAFRAGMVDGTQWDSANVGVYSTAFGQSTIASGSYSTAFGAYTTASGDFSTAFGDATDASGDYAAAFGNGTIASGDSALAFGRNTSSSGASATAFGNGTTASGTYATAFGFDTQAIGDLSTAFGNGTTASGEGSMALGSLSIASGHFSAAFGQNSIANGSVSTAFGSGSTASGDFSTSFGSHTTASGFSSTVFGEGTVANSYDNTALGRFNVGGGTAGAWISTDPLFEIGNGANSSTLSNALTVLKNGKVGIGTATPNALLDLEGDGTIIAVGTDGSGMAVPDLGAGTRMMWIPSKSAFRAGYVPDTEWDSANIGDRSAAFGGGNIASGYDSFAAGYGNIVSGDDSSAFGLGNIVSGNTSVAFGGANTASGDQSAAFGVLTTASGFTSVAFGSNTTASASGSFVLGRYNIGGGSPTSLVPTDPLFEIGIGTDPSNSGALADALIVLQNGNTGIGLGAASPTHALDVGNSSISGIVARFRNSAGTCDINPLTSSLTCSSDMSLKKNISNLADSSTWSFNNNISSANQSILNKVLALNPVSYNWNTEQGNTVKHPGFIAQEVQEVFPDLVATDPETQLLSLNYTGLIPYTVQAIKEMNLNITDIADLTKTNTWRDAITNWLGSATNGIGNIFSKQVTTPTLCVGTNDNKTCITKDQLDHLLQQQGGGGASVPADSSPTDPSPADTPPADVPPAGDQTKQVDKPVITPPVDPVPTDPTPPADVPPASTQTPQ